MEKMFNGKLFGRPYKFTKTQVSIMIMLTLAIFIGINVLLVKGLGWFMWLVWVVLCGAWVKVNDKQIGLIKNERICSTLNTAFVISAVLMLIVR